MFYAYSPGFSGNLASLAIVTLLLLYTAYNTVHPRLRTLVLLVPPCLMILRFLVASVFTFGVPVIIFLIDTTIAGIYIGILYLYHRKRWGLIIFFLLSFTLNVANILMLFNLIPSLPWIKLIIRSYGIITLLAVGGGVYLMFRAGVPSAARLHVPMIVGMGIGVIFGILSPLPVQWASFLGYNFISPVSLGAFFFPVLFMTETRRFQLEDAVRRQTQSLDSIFDFMRKIGTALGEHEGVERILDFFVHALAGYTRADGCAVFILNDLQEALEVRSVVGFYPPPYALSSEMEQAQFDTLEEHFRKTPINIGEGLIGKTLAERRVQFIPVLNAEQRKEIYGEYLTLGEVGSFLSIPLTAEAREFGVISIVRSNTHPPFSDLDFSHAEIFSRYISLIIDNRNDYLQLLEKQQIEQEIGIAAEIQSSLLPKGTLSSATEDVAVMFSPLQGVSGDYYDVIHKANNVLVLICDIAGKGISACLLMVLLRTVLHFSINQYGVNKLHEILVEINQAVLNAVVTDRFATMSLVTYVPEEKVLLYGNAGHLPLLIWSEKEKAVKNINAGGLPIGIDKSFSAEIIKIPVDKGDYVLLYTDGILEARNSKNEEYQEKRLISAFSQAAITSSPAKEVLRSIIVDVGEFSDKVAASDDQTLLVMKIGE